MYPDDQKTEGELIKEKNFMARKKSYQKGVVALHNGHWTVRYYSIDQFGNKSRKRERLLGLSDKASKKDALKAANPIMIRVNNENNKTIDKKKIRITFKEFTETLWKSYQENAKTKVSTRDSYNSILKVYLMPEFGDRYLSDLTPSDMTKFFDSLVGRASAKYSGNIYALLNTMLEIARQYDLIENSPLRTKLHKPRIESEEKPILTVEEILKIIYALKEEHRLFFVILFVTGCRVGEACGFRWQDLDFHQKVLKINHSIYRGQLLTPKSASSKRSYELPDDVMYDLLFHRQSSKFKDETDFIFTNPEGKPLCANHVRANILYPALEKAGIQRGQNTHGFHIFRHSAGSILYDKTGRTKLVQQLLGHSREQITADLYIHLPKSARGQGAKILAEELYAGFSKSNSQDSGLIN